MDMKKVSVLILSWNRKDEVKKTLEILDADSYNNKQIVVVDNGSTDGTIGYLHSLGNRIILVDVGCNIGIDGYNKGFDKCSGDFVLILDDDSAPEPGSIQRAVEKFNDQQIGLIACNILDIEKKSTTSILNTNEVIGGTWSFIGCGAFVRTDIIKRIGFIYPKSYFLYTNEQYLATKVLNFGYRISYSDDIKVIHRVASANRSSDRYIFYDTRNQIWFFFEFFKKSIALRIICRRLLFQLLGRVKNFKNLYNYCKGVIAGFIFSYQYINREKINPNLSKKLFHIYASERFKFHKRILKKI